jgi:ATP-dependent DNA ligase
MNLETLYKRSKTGAVQYYTIKVERGVKDSDPATIVKETGQLGTDKPLIHREVISEGKNIGRANETTTLGQARNQAKSDWTKKKDGGYKTLSDLGIEEIKVNSSLSAYAVKVSNDNKLVTLYKALELALPEFNTDALGNVKPMLAKECKPNCSNVKFPAYAQPKLDGVRCLILVTVREIGIGCSIKFISRTGKEYTTLNHIADNIATAVIENKLDSFILDGEIYHHDIEFEEIIEAVKKTNDNTKDLKFVVYDLVTEGNVKDRYSKLGNICFKINSKHIEMIDTTVIDNAEEIQQNHDDYVEQGYEGLMIRNMDGIYGQGQRSSDLLKFKVFKTDEFEFDRFVLGQRGIMDMKAMCKTAEGKEFGAKMKGSLKHKTMLYNAGHKAGEQMTVKYSNMTKYDIPRFPVGLAFRDYE